MRSARLNSHPRKSDEGGYILLVLILFVALLAIAAAAVAPSIAFQVKRDREEELVHRGVQYSRAVRRYYKKFNRYPTKIEDLESSNNLRFLRKRYKDPMTGNDFKVLHLSEIQSALAGNAIGGLSPSQPGGGIRQPANGFGANNSSGGSNSNFSLSSNSADSAKPADAENGTADAGEGSQPGQSTFGTNSASKNGPNGASGNTDKLAGQTFGGGPIAGVVSTSKAASVREFNKKNHYNQWLFIYDPQSDRGGLLSTPNQPPLAGTTDINGNPGAPGSSPGIPGLGNQNPTSPGSPFGGGAQQTPQTPQTPPEQ